MRSPIRRSSSRTVASSSSRISPTVVKWAFQTKDLHRVLGTSPPGLHPEAAESPVVIKITRLFRPIVMAEDLVRRGPRTEKEIRLEVLKDSSSEGPSSIRLVEIPD